MNSEFIGICRELESWYASESGVYAHQSIEQSLQGVLDKAFGYHLLQLGITAVPGLYKASTINHCVNASPREHAATGLLTDLDELPFESESIDVLIAHHALEFAPNAQQVLREMQRVLAPQGHLLIVGFAPYTPLGVGHWLKGVVGHPLWRNRQALSIRRIDDWLNLLGCDLQDIQQLCAFPPSGRLRSLAERINAHITRHKWPLGGIYCLHAIKQMPGAVKPQRHRPRRRRNPLLGMVPEPSAARQQADVVPISRGARTNSPQQT